MGVFKAMIFPQELGSVDISTKPEQDSDKSKEASVAVVELIKTGKDTPKPLNLVEEALNQMAFFVKMLVIVTWLEAMLAGRDDWDGAHGSNLKHQLVVVIPLVSDDMVAAVALQ